MENKEKYLDFEDLLEKRHGKIGSPSRDDFELKSKAFIIGEIIPRTAGRKSRYQEKLYFKN
jgi:hypothetical protein